MNAYTTSVLRRGSRRGTTRWWFWVCTALRVLAVRAVGRGRTGVLLCLGLLLCSRHAQCLPADTQPTVAEATARIAEIRSRWNACRPRYRDDPFTRTPHAAKPFETGELSQDFVADALNVLNFARYLVGLPADISIDLDLADRAQHGAVTLAGLDTLTHVPTCPPGMDAEFYRLGKESCQSSNIACGTESLAHSVMLWLDDGCGVMGHRRQFLAPLLQRTGFGFAESVHGYSYSSAEVLGENRTDPVYLPYVAYPSPAAFPLEFLQPLSCWTLSLSRAVYAEAIPAQVCVRLERLRDHKVWDLRPVEGATPDSQASGSYLAVDVDYYGEPNCVIFRPGGVGSYQDGDTFMVSVTGVRTLDGAAASVEYSVTFFGLDQPKPSQASQDIVVPDTPPSPQKQTPRPPAAVRSSRASKQTRPVPAARPTKARTKTIRRHGR